MAFMKKVLAVITAGLFSAVAFASTPVAASTSLSASASTPEFSAKAHHVKAKKHAKKGHKKHAA
jgi:hypothetical protein